MGAHIANMMPHIPQIPCQTGLVRTGMVIRPRQGKQCPLLDFNFLEKQINKSLQDPIQDISLDLPDSDNKIEKDLMKDMQALTLKGDTDTKTVTDIQATNREEPNNNNQMTEEGDSSVPPYEMSEQEL